MAYPFVQREKYIETSMSREARKILNSKIENGEIRKGSPLERDIANLKYKPREVKIYGKDVKRIYKETIVHLDPFDIPEEIRFLKRVVEFNLNKDQLEELVKERYRFSYGPEAPLKTESFGLEKVKEFYPQLCEGVGIEPDPHFPDWEIDN